MLIVKNESDNPFFNHAAEEYMLENFDEECFMLWINRPSILIGRNQNAMAEINMEYVKENDPFETDPIKVERGAVFCKFTLWLMKNHLIPAWADEMQKIEKEKTCVPSSLDDSQVNHNHNLLI